MKKDNTPLIETERLILRRFTDDDVAEMFLIYSDEEVNEFLPWFPFQSVEETREYLHNNIFADYAKDIAYRYAVVYKQSNQVIGYVSLGGFDERTASGELGYGLRKQFWGQGIIPEASKAVLEKLKENGFHFVTATHDVNNPKSEKVMQKLGMTYRSSYDEMWQPKNFKVTFKLYRMDFQ
ncbi:GNAT family N-acetyltransferase [Paenibacillus sp. LMG 31456]|uniref:GNAT family N-acetyltransferase n=1 Tax=Paenibacillus foliorum TaxID=2654974 RepID=A0A972GM14_9BACL|nr:GNAT family N-acetyltransferase [Paenibacillus foliorum]NOU92495.1 GNAT family N-acetyltransferase [Paenibacillus foliorum]